jgi:hypothetical protein
LSAEPHVPGHGQDADARDGRPLPVGAGLQWVRLEGICVAHDGRIALNYAKYYDVSVGARRNLCFVNQNLDPATVDAWYGSATFHARQNEGWIVPAIDGVTYHRGGYWMTAEGSISPNCTRLTLPDNEVSLMFTPLAQAPPDATNADLYNDAKIVNDGGRPVLLYAVYKGTAPGWYGCKCADDANPVCNLPGFNSMNQPGDPRVDLANSNKGPHSYPYRMVVVGYDMTTWQKIYEWDLSQYALTGASIYSVESLCLVGNTLWVVESRGNMVDALYEHPHVLHAFTLSGVSDMNWQISRDGILAGTVPAEETQFTDIAPAPGPHTYTVEAVEGAEVGVPGSTSIIVPTPPPPLPTPQNVRASMVGQNVFVDWD